MHFLLFVLVSCRVQLTSVQELKKVRRTHFSECAYLPKCLRVLTEVSTSYLFSWVCRTRCRGGVVEEPLMGRYFFKAQGASPGLGIDTHFFWAPLGAALLRPQHKPNVCAESAAPEGAHITFRFVCTQGFISGFALIPPWAMQEYRPKGLIYVSSPIHLLCCFEAVCVGWAFCE